MSERRLRTLIIDDEAPARRRLYKLCASQSHLQVVGQADSGSAALEEIHKQRPDLLFLDVQMPEKDGFAVLAELPDPPPLIIFVTAYDRYAVRAFDENAVDYLLKPLDNDRFERAVQKAVRRFGSPDRFLQQRLQAVLAAVQQALPPGKAGVSGRIPVKRDGRVYFVDLEAVDYFRASGKYTEVVCGKQEHLVRKTLAAFERQLNGTRFVRIHRSLIVNVDRIVEIANLTGGCYQLRLRDGTRLDSGPRYARSVRRLVDT